MWLLRFGAVCGIVLGLSLGVPGAVEAFTGETAVTSFIIGLGAAFGAPALTALYLRQREAAGKFGAIAYAINVIGLGLFAGVGSASISSSSTWTRPSPKKCSADRPGSRFSEVPWSSSRVLSFLEYRSSAPGSSRSLRRGDTRSRFPRWLCWHRCQTVSSRAAYTCWPVSRSFGSRYRPGPLMSQPGDSLFAMDSMRPVPWVSPVLYLAVLISGIYADISGLGDTHMPLFLIGMAALFAVEFVRHQILAFVLRTAFIVLAAQADGSGLSRALFVLVPFTAYFVFGRATSIAVGVACLGLLITSLQLSNSGWTSNLEQVSDVLMFALGLILAIAMASVAVEERRGRKQIASLSAIEERHRVLRDIHDDLGHHLTAVIVLLEKASAFRDREPSTAARALEDATLSARQALEDVRQSVRPFNFRTSLAGLAHPVSVTGDETPYSETTLAALYRAAQEGITNARRHAQATSINASVQFTGTCATLTITDDGTGFAPASEGFGLRSMRDRVRLAGGEVSIQSADSLGTTLKVIIPKQQSR
jgi:signal transduction histidine kinase